MKRKILSLILVFAMTVSLLTVGTGAVEPTYGDTAGHWAESSIERWSAYGIIQGSNGQFDPNGQLTCAQLATILAKLLKLPAAKDAGFTDNTADAWYYDAINRCAAAGILNGNGDGTVTPEAPITRERAMVMLARALGIEPIRKPDLTKYTDAAQVSAYAQGCVAALIEAGIVGGVTADELAPQDNITRAATVTILDRAIGTYADKAGATVKADGKGLVLVVAENVKITGAPEGTKIVVADGATGLTVNGKSVSDDQTYIVPKATTSSGSSSSGGHSHSYTSTVTKEPTCTEKGVKTYTCSYDGSTYTEEIPALGHALGGWVKDNNHLSHTRTCTRSNCSYSETENCKYTVTTANDKDTYTCPVCGDTYEVGKNSAVRIGETGYANLDTALAAEGENNTIVLLKDLDVTAQINVTKSVTIEGAGHTITAKNTGGWAAGNPNKHLLNITASNVTIKNLTLDSNNQACGNQAFNAKRVTFDNVTMLDSTSIGLTVNRSSVIAKDLNTSGNKWGVNVDKKADDGTLSFTLTGSKSSIGEDLKIWAEKANGPAVVDAAGYYCHLIKDEIKNEEFYAWSTSVSADAVAKAKVEEVDVYYTSLEKALSENAITADVSITLLKDATIDVGANEEKLIGSDTTASITIDGNNHKLVFNSTNSDWNYIRLKNDEAKLTLQNMTIDNSGYGEETGPWNHHDIVFDCKVELQNVIALNSIALEKDAKLTKVSIEDPTCEQDTYVLWIVANGQTVELDDCVINGESSIEGKSNRAITIKDEYVDNPQSVTLKMMSFTISSDKYAAVYVGSKGGANITYEAPYNITNVKSGKMVAIDNSYATTSGPVYVNGTRLIPAGTQEQVNEAVKTAITSSEAKDVKLALPTNSTFTLDNGLVNESNNDGKGRNVTFVGDGTQTMDVITKAISAEGGMLNYQRGSTFTFENVTVQAGEGNFDGIVCDKLVYNNCTIKGKLTLYGKATFINCTFENTMANQYSIWTWGGTDVEFKKCTFNTNGKAILLYGQATAEKPTNLTVSDCTFDDRNNGTAGKAAIEIGNDYNATYSLTVTNATVNGFANGKNTGSKLWANKNSMDAKHLSVTIDGTQVF